MHIVKNKEYIKKNIFDGRNSEWFANLQGNGWDNIYDTFPSNYGIGKQAPEDIDVEKLEHNGYFGFYSISVKDFIEWFVQFRPDVDAGWVHTYDKWLYETKEVIPEVNHYLDSDERIEDMFFITIENKYDCSAWLFNYLNENNIDEDADIIYWFDC